MMDDDFLNSDYSFYSALLQPIIIFFVVNVKFVTFYCFLSELLLLCKTILCNCSLVHFLFRYCAVPYENSAYFKSILFLFENYFIPIFDGQFMLF